MYDLTGRVIALSIFLSINYNKSHNKATRINIYLFNPTPNYCSNLSDVHIRNIDQIGEGCVQIFKGRKSKPHSDTPGYNLHVSMISDYMYIDYQLPPFICSCLVSKC